jgi:hypothetical protein
LTIGYGQVVPARGFDVRESQDWLHVGSSMWPDDFVEFEDSRQERCGEQKIEHMNR